MRGDVQCEEKERKCKKEKEDYKKIMKEIRGGRGRRRVERVKGEVSYC